MPVFLEEGYGLVFLLYLLWKLRPPVSLGLASLLIEDFLLPGPHEPIDLVVNVGFFYVLGCSCVAAEFADIYD